MVQPAAANVNDSVVGQSVPVTLIASDEVPVIRPVGDPYYPDWLWGLNKEKPLLSDLKKKYEAGGEGALTEEELKRLFKLERRQRIKRRNQQEKNAFR